jgi:hypothetical protein
MQPDSVASRLHGSTSSLYGATAAQMVSTVFQTLGLVVEGGVCFAV